MLKKLGNLVDLKAWLETFVLKTVVSKGTKHATTFLTGFIAGPLFAMKIKPVLDQYGITIDPVTLSASVGGAIAGLTGWLLNWVIRVLDKDGDGKVG